MPTAPIQIKGLKELNASLKRFEKDVRQVPQKAGKEAATIVANAARPLARHKSGRMAASIKPSATATGARVRAAGLPYIGVQHFGWPKHHISPNPFLYEAFDQRAPEVLAVYEKRLAELTATIKGL